MKYKNFLFDLDGTLTDPYMGITNSIIHSLKYYPELNVPEREALKPFIGPPLYASYMKYFGMDKKTAEEAVEHYREYYRVKGKLENALYVGIPELLAKLKERGGKVAMATSKPEVFAKEIAQQFGISEQLDYICGSTLDGSLIEKSDIIARVMQDGGFSTEDTVMIGDTVFDIEGARVNGIASVAVKYGYGENEALEKCGATAVVDDVKALTEYLLK